MHLEMEVCLALTRLRPETIKLLKPSPFLHLSGATWSLASAFVCVSAS